MKFFMVIIILFFLIVSSVFGAFGLSELEDFLYKKETKYIELIITACAVLIASLITALTMGFIYFFI